jgi:hypothetical protein
MTDLSLKKSGEDNYDFIADGAVVGRIMLFSATLTEPETSAFSASSERWLGRWRQKSEKETCPIGMISVIATADMNPTKPSSTAALVAAWWSRRQNADPRGTPIAFEKF